MISKKSTPFPFYRSDQRSLISGAFIMHCDIPSALQPHVFCLRLYFIEHVCIVYFPYRVCVRRMAREACKKRVADVGEEDGEK